MHRFARLLSVLAASFMLLSMGVVAVAAQDASPEASPGGGPPLPEGCEVIATDLINPRYLGIADDGTIYVTENGEGGEEMLELPEEDVPQQIDATPVVDEGAEEEEGSPAAEEGGPEGGEEPPLTRGNTGRVTAISPDGEQSVVADGLLSYSGGVGPGGIALGDGVVYISIGGIAVELGIEPAENENSILQIDVATGEATLLAELGSFEEENNPDGTDINPNIYGMDLGVDGQLYVADAGGNTVYRVDPATGEFALVGVVPGPSLPEGEGPPADATPVADEELEGPPQSVPTGVHVGSDGNVYVVTLGAFIPGGAEVLIAQADGSFVQAAGGLAAGVGVAFGPDGSLYVSQLATGSEAGPGPGNVVRINADGTTEVVVDGIPFPHGVEFDADGNLYVVAYSTAFGPPLGPGQVWRCDGIAAA